MAYKVLDIYKDLPRTNCGDCGRPGCFGFASAVYLEGIPVSRCPHLERDACAAIEDKIRLGREEEGGKKADRSQQALTFLLGKLEGLDLAAAAHRCGGQYREGPPESILLELLGEPYRVTRSGVVCEGAGPISIWIKIFLLIYVTRATGSGAEGRWIAYRELPNTVSKTKSFEQTADRLATQFDGDPEGLDRAVVRLGGRATEFGSADCAFRFHALPKVDLLLLFWEREEEFPPRASLLLDAGVLEYLDQEAIVFLAEVLVNLLLGRDLDEVVP